MALICLIPNAAGTYHRLRTKINILKTAQGVTIVIYTFAVYNGAVQPPTEAVTGSQLHYVMTSAVRRNIFGFETKSYQLFFALFLCIFLMNRKRIYL